MSTSLEQIDKTSSVVFHHPTVQSEQIDPCTVPSHTETCVRSRPTVDDDHDDDHDHDDHDHDHDHDHDEMTDGHIKPRAARLSRRTASGRCRPGRSCKR